jgi:hypothetical protein
MKITRIPPSDSVIFKDKLGKGDISLRDCSLKCSFIDSPSSLIDFGLEAYNKHKGSDNLFFVYSGEGSSTGYISYVKSIDFISVNDIYIVCDIDSELEGVFESLIGSVFNICKDLNKKMIIDIDDDKYLSYFLRLNELYKKHNLEDNYWWIIE